MQASVGPHHFDSVSGFTIGQRNSNNKCSRQRMTEAPIAQTHAEPGNSASASLAVRPRVWAAIVIPSRRRGIAGLLGEGSALCRDDGDSSG
jgi:hypothetical protein